METPIKKGQLTQPRIQEAVPGPRKNILFFCFSVTTQTGCGFMDAEVSCFFPLLLPDFPFFCAVSLGYNAEKNGLHMNTFQKEFGENFLSPPPLLFVLGKKPSGIWNYFLFHSTLFRLINLFGLVVGEIRLINAMSQLRICGLRLVLDSQHFI